jgi:hypothetical protein
LVKRDGGIHALEHAREIERAIDVVDRLGAQHAAIVPAEVQGVVEAAASERQDQDGDRPHRGDGS